MDMDVVLDEGEEEAPAGEEVAEYTDVQPEEMNSDEESVIGVVEEQTTISEIEGIHSSFWTVDSFHVYERKKWENFY